MRHLTKTVVAGGVVYSAGTAATPELEELLADAKYWDGPPASLVDAPVQVEASGPAEAAGEPEPEAEAAPEAAGPPKKPARKRAAKKSTEG